MVTMVTRGKFFWILILKTRILSYLRTKAEFSNHHTISNGYDGNKRNCKIFRILILKTRILSHLRTKAEFSNHHTISNGYDGNKRNCKIFRLE
jgi:hypothetical protein